MAPIARRLVDLLTTFTSLKPSKEAKLLKQRANALLALLQSPRSESPFHVRVWPRIQYCAVVHSPQGVADHVVRILPFSADRKRIVWTCEELHAVVSGLHGHERQERRLLPTHTAFPELTGTSSDPCAGDERWPDGTAHLEISRLARILTI